MAVSTAPITSEHLLVDDADTPADEIVYTIRTAATNGDVIIGGVGVWNFTQQQINDKRVLFAHRGDPHASRLSFVGPGNGSPTATNVVFVGKPIRFSIR